MYIRKAILHILDKAAGNLLLSQQSMDLEQPLIHEYINKLITKIGKSEIKQGSLEEGSKIAALLQDTGQTFEEKSFYLADRIYQIIAPAEEISAADYLFFEASDDLEDAYFGVIRLDYSSQFTHYLDVEAGVVNQLVMNHAILPAVTQKPSEAFLVNVTRNTYELLEKQYTIEGKKTLYFSQQVLELEPPKATGQQIKQIKKVVAEVAKQYDEAPYKVLADTQKVIYQQLEEEHEIDAERLVAEVFEHNVGAQVAVRESLEQKEVPAVIAVSNVPKYEKKYSKQKFQLANGIELFVPVDLYDNPDIIEFVNQPDGSISVIIKNIEAITNKFNG